MYRYSAEFYAGDYIRYNGALVVAVIVKGRGATPALYNNAESQRPDIIKARETW
jgi:hypothetical protein